MRQVSRGCLERCRFWGVLIDSQRQAIHEDAREAQSSWVGGLRGRKGEACIHDAPWKSQKKLCAVGRAAATRGRVAGCRLLCNSRETDYFCT